MNTPTPPPIRRQRRVGAGAEPRTRRSFAVSDHVWFAALREAHLEGVTLASVLVRALEDYVETRRAARGA